MKIVLILLFIFLTNQGYSQEFVVSPSRENIVYLGVDNPLEVVVENNPCKSILLTTDNGRIEINSEKCYGLFNPAHIGKATINVNLIRRKDTLYIGKRNLRVKNIPDPMAKIAGKKGETISKNVLAAQMVVLAELENFDIDVYIRVKEYKVLAIRNQQALFIKDITGMKFTDELKEDLRSLQSGDRVLFYDIIAVFPDRREIKLNLVEFTIE